MMVQAVPGQPQNLMIPSPNPSQIRMALGVTGPPPANNGASRNRDSDSRRGWARRPGPQAARARRRARESGRLGLKLNLNDHDEYSRSIIMIVFKLFYVAWLEYKLRPGPPGGGPAPGPASESGEASDS